MLLKPLNCGIAIAYTCAILSDRNSRQMGLQKYVCRLKELQRTHRRHSAFWVDLYGQMWIAALESCLLMLCQRFGQRCLSVLWSG